MKRLVALSVGAALLLAGCGLTPAAGPAAAPPVPPPVSAAAPVPEPLSIEIPKIEAKGDLVALGLAADGTLEVPPVSQPLVPAWWDGSPRPGADGPAVITGHVDGGGKPGIFYRLDDLRPGDLAQVHQVGGTTITFEVYQVEQYAKDEKAARDSDFPVFDHKAVYGNTAGPELRLITCGGPYRRSVGHYADNVVIFMRVVDA